METKIYKWHKNTNIEPSLQNNIFTVTEMLSLYF